MMQYPPPPGQQNPPNAPRVAPPMGNPAPQMAPPGAPPITPPMGPSGPRRIVQRNPNAGGGYWGLRANRIWRNLLDGPGRSLGIMISCAAGIALAIAIIGIAGGLQAAINNILTPTPTFDPNRLNINVGL